MAVIRQATLSRYRHHRSDGFPERPAEAMVIAR
jgi:hypothetical protein